MEDRMTEEMRETARRAVSRAPTTVLGLHSGSLFLVIQNCPRSTSSRSRRRALCSALLSKLAPPNLISLVIQLPDSTLAGRANGQRAQW